MTDTVAQEEFQGYAKGTFDLFVQKVLKLEIFKEYPFSTDGLRQAHTDIESRASVGK